MIRVVWTAIVCVLFAAPAARASEWAMASYSHHVIALDARRTATGYRVVVHQRDTMWAPRFGAVGCPESGELSAGTTMLELVRQRDGTFDVTMSQMEFYAVGPDGPGSLAVSGCVWLDRHYTGQFVDRAAATALDPGQVGLYPRAEDSFLVLQPKVNACPVPEDAKRTCLIDVPFKPVIYAPLIDTDDDGLPDEWELSGVRAGGQFLDLHAMGADPDHKDVFLQLDSTADTAYSQDDLDDVIRSFGRLPISNPDGRNGIRLHIDAGEGSKLDDAGHTWGHALSRANPSAPVPEHFSTFSDAPCGRNLDEAPFTALMAHLDPLRAKVFRYAVAVKFLGPSTDCYTGMNWTIPSVGFVIADWGPPDSPGGAPHPLDSNKRVGTLMHELGHSLGLRHGGDEEHNFKPNYQSVMNYAYQFVGIGFGTPGAAIPVFAYSTTTPSPANQLDENTLDESAGFPDVVAPGTLINYTCDARHWLQGAPHQPTDMDCIGGIVAGPSRHDVTPGPEPATVLHTFDDAAHLVLEPTRGAPTSGAGARVAAESMPVSAALAQAAAIYGDHQPPTVRVTLERHGRGRRAVVIAKDDVGVGTAIVTSGGHDRVLMLARAGKHVPESKQTIDVAASGPVDVVVVDLAGKSAHATAR